MLVDRNKTKTSLRMHRSKQRLSSSFANPLTFGRKFPNKKSNKNRSYNHQILVSKFFHRWILFRGWRRLIILEVALLILTLFLLLRQFPTICWFPTIMFSFYDVSIETKRASKELPDSKEKWTKTIFYRRVYLSLVSLKVFVPWKNILWKCNIWKHAHA